MIDTTTKQHPGHVSGRARPVASDHRAMGRPMSHTWRTSAVAFLGCRTTGVAEFGTDAYLGNATDPAGTTGLTSIKPTARHLAARST